MYYIAYSRAGAALRFLVGVPRAPAPGPQHTPIPSLPFPTQRMRGVHPYPAVKSQIDHLPTAGGSPVLTPPSIIRAIFARTKPWQALHSKHCPRVQTVPKNSFYRKHKQCQIVCVLREQGKEKKEGPNSQLPTVISVLQREPRAWDSSTAVLPGRAASING